MAKWFYYNENGEKIEVTGTQLKELAKQGIVTPNTTIETEEGKSAPARRVKGLTFVVAQNETASLSEPTPLTSDVAPAVKESPVAVSVSLPADVSPSTSQGTPNATALMWMHWAWIFVPIASLIIWTVIKDKEAQANTHGKHVLNAFLTFMIYSFIFGVSIAITTIVQAVIHETFSSYNDDFIPVLISGIISLIILAGILFFSIRAVISAIKIGIAAGNGEIIPYKWAICFLKTNFCGSDSSSNSYKGIGREFVILGLFFFGAIFANGIYYTYSQQKSAAIERNLDEFVVQQRKDTEDFITKQQKETDDFIAARHQKEMDDMRASREREKKQEEEKASKFIEDIEKAEHVPVFNGGYIKQLVNAESILSPFTKYGTIRYDELPEPYKKPSIYNYSVTLNGMPVVLLDGTNLLFFKKDDFKVIWDILRKRDYDRFGPEPKEDVLRNRNQIMANDNRLTRSFAIAATNEDKIRLAVMERYGLRLFFRTFPEEKQDVADAFLQAGFVNNPSYSEPFGIIQSGTNDSNLSRHFYCNGHSSAQSPSSFSIRMWTDINIATVNNRTRIEISTDGEYPIDAQSFRIMNDSGIVFDSGLIRFAEPRSDGLSSSTFKQTVSLNLSNEDRVAILDALSDNGKCEFGFYGSNNRSRIGEMNLEHRERFQKMRGLIEGTELLRVRWQESSRQQ